MTFTPDAGLIASVIRSGTTSHREEKNPQIPWLLNAHQWSSYVLNHCKQKYNLW